MLSREMEEQLQLNPFILTTTILSLIFLWLINRMFFAKPSSTQNKLPPSPSPLPIIGNIHQIGRVAHRDLHSLAQKHGPIMLLRFGSVPVLVISSAEWAREIMKTHDLIFASRPPFKVSKKFTYGFKDVALAPYGENWRQRKSIVVLQLLNSKRVDSFRSFREEETASSVDKIRACLGSSVDLSAMFASFSSDGIARATFGKNFSESEDGKKFLGSLGDVLELVGAINIADFVPWLGWINRLNGFDKRLDNTSQVIDGILENIIEHRQHAKMDKDAATENMGQDFLDILLQLYHDESGSYASIDRDSVKALLMDTFAAGTDTTSTTLEWAMSELLRNPRTMQRLQGEVREIANKKAEITSDDIEKMQYLKAVIKETLRCHPPLPLLVPRVATKDVIIKGDYQIAAGTWVMINAWAIGRDPISWDNPHEFMPERFLNSSIDFKGQDFEFIPFGAGRRGCPGITYASGAMEVLLANLMHKFDWELPNKIEAKDLDMSESTGITARRAFPLLAIASHAK